MPPNPPHKKTILAKRAFFMCVLDQAKHTLVLFPVSKASEAPTVELLLGIGKHMHCDQKFKKEKLKLKLKPKKKGEGVGHNQYWSFTLYKRQPCPCMLLQQKLNRKVYVMVQ
jgi:hypothetical protein